MRTLAALFATALAMTLGCGNSKGVATGSGASSSTTTGAGGSTSGAGSTAASSTGATSSSGAATTGGASGTTGGGPAWPIMPYYDGGVLSAPNLIFMTYADDPNQPVLEQYGVWIADGGYLPLVAGEYGIGNGTVQFVNLTDTPPMSTSLLDNPFPAYLDQHFASDPTMPPDAPNNLYVLIMPASWPSATLFCQFFGGFHDHYLSTVGTGHTPLYAVIGNCDNESVASLETTISHEVVEGATDPVTTSWVFLNPDDPWFSLTGELADMCESNSIVYTQGQFSGQLIWSNRAAAAGEVPCQPWPASSTYLSIIAPPAMATAPVGGQVQIPLTGWASGSFTGSFELLVQSLLLVPADGGYDPLFNANPELSSETITPGQTVTLTLSVPSGTPSGQSGAVWVIADDTATGNYVGSALVGVIAQ